MDVASKTRKSVGRKPDLEIESKVYSAVIEMYSEVGWAGFTIDAVSRLSRVGKAAMYARWANKADLFADALLSIPISAKFTDTGTFRGDLIGLTSAELKLRGGQFGQALRRIEVDAVSYPELLASVQDRFRKNANYHGRKIIKRAIERKELPAGASATLILDALSGSVRNRLAYLPEDRREEFESQREHYVESLVDFILSAVNVNCPLR